jgi:hypothetical protein
VDPAAAPVIRSLRVWGDEGNLPSPLSGALRMRSAAAMNQQANWRSIPGPGMGRCEHWCFGRRLVAL